MPYTFNSTNPVAVGDPTRKDHYDRVFENTLALTSGDAVLTLVRLAVAALPAASGSTDAVIAADTVTKQLLASIAGGKYRPVMDAGLDPLFVANAY